MEWVGVVEINRFLVGKDYLCRHPFYFWMNESVSQRSPKLYVRDVISNTRSIEGLFQARSVSYRIEEVAGVVGGGVVVGLVCEEKIL